MKPEFHPAAEAEFLASAAWYEGRAPSLGVQMREQVHRAIAVLCARPLIGKPLTTTLRQFPLRRFPYKLIYRVGDGNLRIIAVAHIRRRPGYWAVRR
jgi:plasmid stabilization system protein ParE